MVPEDARIYHPSTPNIIMNYDQYTQQQQPSTDARVTVQLGLGVNDLHWYSRPHRDDSRDPEEFFPIRSFWSMRQLANLHSLNIEWQLSGTRSPDPSFDPFKQCAGKFPGTLKSLNLSRQPIYKSISEINTLTEFTFHFEGTFDTPTTILTFLIGNPSLENVVLVGAFPDDLKDSNPRVKPQLKNLKSLTVEGERQVDLNHLINLISCLPLPKGAHVNIHSRWFGYTLLSIERTLRFEQPTHLRMDCPDGKLEFSGPNENKVSISSPPHSGIVSPLTIVGTARPLFRGVESLFLEYSENSSRSETLQELLTLLPALTIFTIKDDANGTPTTHHGPFPFPLSQGSST